METHLPGLSYINRPLFWEMEAITRVAEEVIGPEIAKWRRGF